jgi:hypothetical protein
VFTSRADFAGASSKAPTYARETNSTPGQGRVAVYSQRHLHRLAPKTPLVAEGVEPGLVRDATPIKPLLEIR